MTRQPDLKRQLCGKGEAATVLGVGIKIVRRLIKSGDLKTVLVGEREKVDIADIHRFIEEGKKQWHSDAGKAHRTGGTASALAVVDFAEARKKRPAKRPS